jgi:hydroxymethylpyrimidine pyrophosphatase-like HAD family hydrolase
MAKSGVAQQTNRAKNGKPPKSGTASGKQLGAKKQISGKTKDAQHVVEQNGSWVVKSERSGKPLSQPYYDKREAIDAGRKLARELGNDLLVQGKSGQTFQHSPAASSLTDDSIRMAIRFAKAEKTAASRHPKKSVAKKK